MNMNNCCHFEGRLTKDPELKQSTNKDGSTFYVCTFTVALGRQKTKNNKEPGADFILCKAAGVSANNIYQYFKKGSVIKLCCSFVSYTKEQENGELRYGSYFKVEQWTFPFTTLKEKADYTNDANYTNDTKISNTTQKKINKNVTSENDDVFNREFEAFENDPLKDKLDSSLFGESSEVDNPWSITS